MTPRALRPLALLSLCLAPLCADNKEVFDLRRYSQNLDQVLPPTAPGQDTRLISAQTQEIRKKELVDRLFGNLSPWSRDTIQALLNRPLPDRVKTWEESMLKAYTNQDKPATKLGHGTHYRPYAPTWIEGLAARMNLAQLDTHTTYDPSRRAITVTNLHCRVLPTDDPHFYSHTLPGEGYPFDNLQNSALWAGTAVYVLATTTDGGWSLVLTPDFMGWVKSEGLATTDDVFVQMYRFHVSRTLLAITAPDTPVRGLTGAQLLNTYPGTVLPAAFPKPGFDQTWQVLLPVRNTLGRANLTVAQISHTQAKAMPVEATPRQIKAVMKGLLGRQYGWGGMQFNNDCSQELKGLFTPFGIYMARNSAGQAAAGRQVDMGAATPQERTRYLQTQGRPFTTLVFIGGHVMLYLGNTPLDGQEAPMTYQNIWGLSPADRSKRSILGGSVLLPLLDTYPEDPTLQSLAAKSRFVVSFLDELPAAPKTLMAAPEMHQLVLPTRETEGLDRN